MSTQPAPPLPPAAERQVHALELPVGTTPGGAVAAWFIPFINLVKPYRVARNLAGVLGADSAQVGLWWGLWMAGGLLGPLSLSLEMRQRLGLTSASTALWVGVLAELTNLAAAGLCIHMVRAVQRELNVRRY